MFKLICLIVGLCLIAIPNCSSTPVANEVNYHDLEVYYEELKKNVDLDAKPCDDYSKYSCGKLSDKKFQSVRSMVEYYFINNEPKSNYEIKVRDMYLSCTQYQGSEFDISDFLKNMLEQVDFLKNLDSYPTKREYTAKEIGKMAGELAALGDEKFLTIDIDIENDAQVLSAIKNTAGDQTDQIAKVMAVIGDSKGDSEIAAKQVYEFITKLNELYNFKPKPELNKYVSVNSIEELNNLLPSNSLDWDEFYNSVKQGISTSTKNHYIYDVEFMKKFVELVDQTDKNTLMNYFVHNIIDHLIDFSCSDVDLYYRPAILRKLWDENLTPKDISRYTEFLNELESSLVEEHAETNIPEKYNMRYQIEIIRDVLTNHKTLITEEFLNEYYNKFEVDPNNFYKNLINYNYQTMRYYQRPDIEKYFNGTEGLTFNVYYDNAIHPSLHDKPFYYYYTIINYNMWYKYYLTNNVYENITVAEECLSQQNEKHDQQFKNNYFMAAYAAQVATYLHFIRFAEYMENSQLYQETQHLMKNTDVGNPEKLYYMGLAQHDCHHRHEILEDTMFRVFRNTKEFSKAYNCPDDSAMNKYNYNKKCVLSECHNENTLHQHVWPYELPNC